MTREMRRVRVIPVLLLDNGGLVKTVRFRRPAYVGDPINAVKILNEKEVDELVLLDVSATRNGRPPEFDRIAEIGGEAFMPLAYGGGVRTVGDVARILGSGVEKVVLNTAAAADPGLVTGAARRFGSQAVMASVDVKRNLFGRYRVFTHGGRRNTGVEPVEYCRRMEELGAGEILLTSMDRDGTFAGYDLELLRRVSVAVEVPVVACGGARRVEDFVQAVNEGGASAVAAGSMFVFHGPHRAVLISYPEPQVLKQQLFSAI